MYSNPGVQSWSYQGAPSFQPPLPSQPPPPPPVPLQSQQTLQQ